MPSPEQNLDRALANDELVLYFQPIHDVKSGKTVSAEALLRWRHPHHGDLGAVQLAAAAERGPRIFHLEQWTTECAVREAKKWLDDGEDVHVNLNLSAREFEERDIVPFVDEVLKRNGTDPRKINLEITEKSFIRKLGEVAKVLEELKKRGLSIWLDDFGTGHSSIIHLKEFPVDGIKIPATYVCDVVENRISRAIGESLARLASDLDLGVIVEGVETEEQLRIVTGWGCSWIQGYLFSKPLRSEEFREYLRNSSR
jgi:EAL domain-containing protein (putative c-di-GMP-specific phosphodiesterase class I)